jgi:sulfur carrier protein
MQIVFNGTSIPLASGPEGTAPTLAALLASQGLGERRVAVEVNGAVVPKSRHASTHLHDGDRIEVVHALGGG